ncbi:MAG: TatD family deoxyribonuclease [Chloroflexi bacterium]|nr:TatD family deoxyribonuclease [Chloroflexota bacterium]
MPAHTPQRIHAPIVDAHAHTFSREFRSDHAQTMARAWAAGLVAVVEVGGDVESSRQALALARATPERVFAIAGVHPHAARDFDAEHEALRALLDGGGFVAIGEIGLDFYRNLSPPEAQFAAFAVQLELAREYALPVVLHVRNADEDAYAQVEPWARRVGRYLGAEREIGMLHCYAGDAELAARYIALGFAISVPGPVTYADNTRGQEVARTVPLASLLVETDAPYLTPVPFRGTRNEPAYVVETVRAVAALRGCRAAEVAAATARNAARLFGVTLQAQVPA